MNKIFKVIWSKTKNCYVVASELAKTHTKSSSAKGFSKSLVCGVLGILLLFGFATPSVMAYEASYNSATKIMTITDPDGNTFDYNLANNSSFRNWDLTKARYDTYTLKNLNGQYVSGQSLISEDNHNYAIINESLVDDYLHQTTLSSELNLSEYTTDRLGNYYVFVDRSNGQPVLFDFDDGNQHYMTTDFMALDENYHYIVTGQVYNYTFNFKQSGYEDPFNSKWIDVGMLGNYNDAVRQFVVDGRAVSFNNATMSWEPTADLAGWGPLDFRPNDGSNMNSVMIGSMYDAGNTAQLDTNRHDVIIGGNIKVDGFNRLHGITAIGSNMQIDNLTSENNAAYSTAIGYGTHISAPYATSVGTENIVKSRRGVAIGSRNIVTEEGGVAIGDESVTNSSNTVSFGHSKHDLDINGVRYGYDSNKRLIHIDQGLYDTDAPNMSQLTNGMVVNGNEVSLVDKNGKLTKILETENAINAVNVHRHNVIAEGGPVIGILSNNNFDYDKLKVYGIGDREIDDIRSSVNMGEVTVQNMMQLRMHLYGDTQYVQTLNPDWHYDSDRRVYVNNITGATTTTPPYVMTPRFVPTDKEIMNSNFLSNLVSSGQITQSYYNELMNYLKNCNGWVDSNGNSVVNNPNSSDYYHLTPETAQEFLTKFGVQRYSDYELDEIANDENYVKLNVRNFGVNGSATNDINEFGGGAIGTGSVAIGVNSVAEGNNSIAVGSNNSVTKENSISIGTGTSITGKNSIAIGNNNVVSGENSVAIGNNLSVTDDNVVLIGTRRVTGVSDGTSATDAATVGQTFELVAGSGMTVEEDGVNAIGQKKYKLNSTATGGTTYISGDNIVIEDDVISAQGLIKYDGADKQSASLEGTRGTKLTNLKAASLVNGSTDAVIGHQLWQTNENIRGFAQDISTNSNNITNLTTSVTNALSSVSAISTTIDAINSVKADASLNNLTDIGRQVIASAAANAVQEYMRENGGNGGSTGSGLLGGSNSTLSASVPRTMGFGLMANQMNNGNDDIVTNNDNLNDNSDNTISQAVQDALDTKVEISDFNTALDLKADKDLVYSKTETDNFLSKKADLTYVNDELNKKADVSYVDAGLQTKADKDSVYTKSETDLFLQTKADKSDLLKKANIDGSNIDAKAWSSLLGTGKVEENNKELVNGGTVYDSLVNVVKSNPVQIDNTTIYVGKQEAYDNASIIDVSNSKGKGRIMTGVITNPDDKGSVANVAYVDSVGETIASQVNQGFTSLDTKINTVNGRVDKVGANAAAIASLMPAPMEGGEKWSMSASVGNFSSETAGAIGLFYRPNDSVIFNVRGTVNDDNNMIGGGVSFNLDKPNHPAISKAQMIETINAQAEKIVEQDQKLMAQDERMQQQEQEIVQLKAVVNQLVKTQQNK